MAFLAFAVSSKNKLGGVVQGREHSSSFPKISLLHPTPCPLCAGFPFHRMTEEKAEIDQRSIYVGNVSEQWFHLIFGCLSVIMQSN